MTIILHILLTSSIINKKRMNNLEAYNLLKRHNEIVSDATKDLLKIFQLPETEHEHFRSRIRDLISERVRFRKNGKFDSLNNTSFHSQFPMRITKY